MRCPYCGSTNTQVKDSRPSEDHTTIRRRRVCADCGGRFTTFERVQLRELTVVKRSGRRMPFDRDKLMRSVQIALRKRPVDPERVERMVSGIVRRLENMGENDIKSETIGRLVMEALKALDDVAYVRFASVYKNFREAKDFEALLGELVAARARTRKRPQPTTRIKAYEGHERERRVSYGASAFARAAGARHRLAQSRGRLRHRHARRRGRGPRLHRAGRPPPCRGHRARTRRPRGNRRHALRHARALRPSGQGPGLRRSDRRSAPGPRRGCHGRSRSAHRRRRARAAARSGHRGCRRRASAEEAEPLALGHVLRVTEGRPAVTLKLAVGSDLRVPRGEAGAPTWVTGDLARAHGHLLRARNDAILVGRGTIMADNPSLTCRLPGMDCRSPVRVVLDRRLRTPPEARLFEDEMVPVWLVCAEDEDLANAEMLQDRGAEIIPVAVDTHGLPAIGEVLEQLARRGITRLLVEGGPAVAREFLDADLIDEAAIYQGERPAGSDGLLPFVSEGLDRLTESGHFTQTHATQFGPDRMTWWERKRSCSPALSAT